MDLQVARYIMLIEQIGNEYGRLEDKWGWQRRVAEKLNADPSIVSSLIRGDRTGVGRTYITKATKALKLDPRWFTDETVREPKYTAYLQGSLSRQTAVTPGDQADEPDPEARTALHVLWDEESLTREEYEFLEEVVADGLYASNGLAGELQALRATLDGFRKGRQSVIRDAAEPAEAQPKALTRALEKGATPLRREPKK